MAIAQEVARMGTCARRQVGCVLVDSRNFMLSTGINGVPPGWGHCRYDPPFECPGARSPSGTNLDQCVANHSEINALIHCKDVAAVRTVYCTTSPCVSCVKALLCTGASRIVFVEQYPHQESMGLWCRYARVVQVPGGHTVEHRTWERFDVESGKTTVVDSSGFKR
jgi:dCMP deaminase